MVSAHSDKSMHIRNVISWRNIAKMTTLVYVAIIQVIYSIISNIFEPMVEIWVKGHIVVLLSRTAVAASVTEDRTKGRRLSIRSTLAFSTEQPTTSLKSP